MKLQPHLILRVLHKILVFKPGMLVTHTYFLKIVWSVTSMCACVNSGMTWHDTYEMSGLQD